MVIHFSISRILILDNGFQFLGKEFEAYLEELNIVHKNSSVWHPQANDQLEVTIEKRFHEAKKKWVEELPGILWAYRTSPKSTTGETPFRLTYGAEAVILIEVRSSSFRIDHFREHINS